MKCKIKSLSYAIPGCISRKDLASLARCSNGGLIIIDCLLTLLFIHRSVYICPHEIVNLFLWRLTYLYTISFLNEFTYFYISVENQIWCHICAKHKYFKQCFFNHHSDFYFPRFFVPQTLQNMPTFRLNVAFCWLPADVHPIAGTTSMFEWFSENKHGILTILNFFLFCYFFRFKESI